MSTLGNEGVEALALQTGRLLNGQPPEKGAFDKQAAFNLIPRVGELDEAGNSQLEQHLAEDVRRILEMPQLPVSVTSVLVPTFFGTAQVMQLRTAEPLATGQASKLLRKAQGVKLLDKPAVGGCGRILLIRPVSACGSCLIIFAKVSHLTVLLLHSY